MEKPTKEFGIYHWDTFEPKGEDTLLVGEADTLEEAEDFVEVLYKDRIRADGADQVHIVDQRGALWHRYHVG